MIEKLPEQIVQQIAAGEVIERPASVLKEMVENSLDAGASRIRVEYEEGGLSQMLITDDGSGISKEDLPLVFESHATSKLKRMSDFDSLSSFGFRGEAMSSISAVAKVEVWTSTEQEDTGHRAAMHHGVWKPVKAADKRLGTEIQVSRLFEKLPVRMKFMKSPQAEARALTSMLKKYALIYPEKHWELLDRAGRSKFKLSPQSDLERALWYFDSGEPKHWFEAQGEHLGWKVHFTGLKPRYFKPSRNSSLIYLNRRPIQDRSVEFALRRAFEGYAENPTQVMGVLRISGDPKHFDVNVHPTKVQVRFKEPDRVFSAVVHVIREALEKIHQNQRPQAQFSAVSPSPVSFDSTSTSSLSFGSARTAPQLVEQPSPQASLFQAELKYQLLGVVDRTYVIASREDKLYLFDQHALHERILYEEIRQVYEKKEQLSSQRLLFPIKVQFESCEKLLEKEELLESLGFELRAWGDESIQVLAVPSILKRDHTALLKSLAQSFEMAKESMLRECLATIACHSAIRAHDYISDPEAQKILDQFQSEDALGHCPHGRPTFVELDTNQLAKFFHRT